MLQVNKFAFAPIIYAEEIFVLNHRRNEGFYLHRLLSNTFEEHQKLGFLLIFGWGTFTFEENVIFNTHF